MSLFDHQNLSKLIEECSEKLDLLEKTLKIEEKQKKRLSDMTMEKEKEKERARTNQLYEGTLTTSAAILDQEERHRKELVEDMVKNATSSNTPVVRCITNVQGILMYIFPYL